MSMRKIAVFGRESLIKDFLFKEREDNSNQFSSGEDESTFVFVGRGFGKFFSVISTEDGVKTSYGVSSFNKPGSEVFIGTPKESGFLSFKGSGLMFRPDKPSKFSNLVVRGERRDIANFRDDTSGIDFTDTWDGGKGISESFKFFFYSLINLFKRLFKCSDVVNKLSNNKMVRRSKFGSNAVRFSGSSFKSLSNFMRVWESVFAVFNQERYKFFWSSRSHIFRGKEFFEEGEGCSRGKRFESFVLDKS